MSRIAVVDTSVLIDHLRGDSRAIQLLVDLARSGAVLWSVTPVRTEVLAGMRPKEEAATRELLDAIRWHEVTVPVADRAGELACRFMKSHPGVDTVDYLLAATVETLEGRLYTQNVKHFPIFAGLEPAYR